jgi:hypothetical protein
MSNVLDLDKLMKRKAAIENTISSMAAGLTKAQQKLSEYDKALSDKDTKYDKDWLLVGREQAQDNIDVIKAAFLDEQNKLAECDKMIKDARNILKHHKICPALHTTGSHDWKVTEIFQFSRNWKKRECRQCDTKEKLGHD